MLEVVVVLFLSVERGLEVSKIAVKTVKQKEGKTLLWRVGLGWVARVCAVLSDS